MRGPKAWSLEGCLSPVILWFQMVLREGGWVGGQDALLPRKWEEAATVAGFALGFGAPAPAPA